MRNTFGIKKPLQADLHLFSLSNFISLIKKILEKSKPSSICEVGVEKEVLMQFLLKYCDTNNATYYAIDPSININDKRVNFIKKPSLEALGQTELCDQYFIDGDHNYYTVFNELQEIKRLSNKEKKNYPLIILHDIGWPCDRRDFYYFPSFVPKNEVHEFETDKGVLPDSKELDGKGIKAENGEFGWSKEYGEEKMGILTAVEDFMQENEPLKLIKIPGIYGIGILYDENSLNETVLDFFNDLKIGVEILGDIISIIEYNRLDQHIYLTNRDKDLTEINQRLKSAEKLAIERIESIDQQSARIDVLENNIRITRELAEERLESINNQSKRIDDLEISLNSANELAKERLQAINNQSRRIDELIDEINHAKKMAEDRLDAINQQSSIINNLDGNLSHANQLCEERLHSINELASKLEEANEVVKNQSNLINEKDKLLEYYRLPLFKKLIRKIKERN